MRALRCVIGRHDWRVGRNPEKGGREAVYEYCARCGKDRPVYDPTDGTGIALGGGVG